MRGNRIFHLKIPVWRLSYNEYDNPAVSFLLRLLLITLIISFSIGAREYEKTISEAKTGRVVYEGSDSVTFVDCKPDDVEMDLLAAAACLGPECRIGTRIIIISIDTDDGTKTVKFRVEYGEYIRVAAKKGSTYSNLFYLNKNAARKLQIEVNTNTHYRVKYKILPERHQRVKCRKG